jgi:hypothetical protein
MKRRALLLLPVAFAFISISTHAQGPFPPGGRGGGPGTSLPDLAAQIAALEARVAKLEGQITMADLAGNYSLFGLLNHLEALIPGAPGSPPQRNALIGNAIVRAAVTLNANGSGSVQSTFTGGVLQQGPWTLELFAESGPNELTWSYDPTTGVGSVLTDEGEQLRFRTAAGGRIWVGNNAESEAGDFSETLLTILVRR